MKHSTFWKLPHWLRRLITRYRPDWRPEPVYAPVIGHETRDAIAAARTVRFAADVERMQFETRMRAKDFVKDPVTGEWAHDPQSEIDRREAAGWEAGYYHPLVRKQREAKDRMDWQEREQIWKRDRAAWRAKAKVKKP